MAWCEFRVTGDSRDYVRAALIVFGNLLLMAGLALLVQLDAWTGRAAGLALLAAGGVDLYLVASWTERLERTRPPSRSTTRDH
jgi:hypothetical protein